MLQPEKRLSSVLSIESVKKTAGVFRDRFRPRPKNLPINTPWQGVDCPGIGPGVLEGVRRTAEVQGNRDARL